MYKGQDVERTQSVNISKSAEPSCLIEAYVRPEKCWLLWAGTLANHLNNFYFIFLSDGLTVAAERAACFADLDRR
jgi:hypothetical protein